MNKEIGYYSLLQYCPDEAVGEVANIGVLLFCPQTGFVDARVTPTNHRVAHIFGGGIHKYDTLQRYKVGLSGWVKAESRRFMSLETAMEFFAAGSNSIIFTTIRSIVCPKGAEKMLETLYDKFFPDEKNTPPEKPQRGPAFSKKRIFRTLQEKFGKDIGNKLAILPELELVGPERKAQPVFAFQNNHFSAVFAKSFNSDRCDEQIGFGLLIASEMKIAKEQYWRNSIPVILGRISTAQHDLSREIAESFKRHSIPFYDDEQKLIDYIGNKAKPLPPFAAKFAAARVEPGLFYDPVPAS